MANVIKVVQPAGGGLGNGASGRKTVHERIRGTKRRILAAIQLHLPIVIYSNYRRDEILLALAGVIKLTTQRVFQIINSGN